VPFLDRIIQPIKFGKFKNHRLQNQKLHFKNKTNFNFKSEKEIKQNLFYVKNLLLFKKWHKFSLFIRKTQFTVIILRTEKGEIASNFTETKTLYPLLCFFLIKGKFRWSSPVRKERKRLNGPVNFVSYLVYKIVISKLKMNNVISYQKMLKMCKNRCNFKIGNKLHCRD
jgi:hypothetical protein